MNISITVLPTYDDPKRITLACDSNEVRLTRRGSGYMFSSIRYGEDSGWVDAPHEPKPLHTLWHHALVFLGAVDPDEVSHPPLF